MPTSTCVRLKKKKEKREAEIRSDERRDVQRIHKAQKTMEGVLSSFLYFLPTCFWFDFRPIRLHSRFGPDYKAHVSDSFVTTVRRT